MYSISRFRSSSIAPLRLTFIKIVSEGKKISKFYLLLHWLDTNSGTKSQSQVLLLKDIRKYLFKLNFFSNFGGRYIFFIEVKW